MNIKTVLASAAAIFSLSSVTAQASEIWTITSHGTIASGYDCPYYSIDPNSPYVGTCPGLFGTPKTSLAGAQYTISITTDFDKDKWSQYQATTDYQMLLGAGPGFKAVVTVDGHSVTFSADQTSEGQLFMSPAGAPKKASSAYVIGRTASDEYVEVSGGGFTYWGLTAGGLYNEVKFSGSATTTVAQRAEIAEPASLGLLALGGLAAMGARRKYRRSQTRSADRTSPSA